MNAAGWPPRITALAAGAAGLTLAVLGVGARADLLFLDALQRSPVVPAPQNQVVIVDLDGETIDDFGWPVDPPLYAAVIQALSDAGAASVGVDVILRDRRWSVLEEGPAAGRRDADPTEGDRMLGEVATRTGTVLGSMRVVRSEAALRSDRSLPPTPPDARVDCALRSSDHALAPLRPGLQGARLGHVNAEVSNVDGVYREVTPCLPVHDGCALALSAVISGERSDTARCHRPQLVPFSRSFADFPLIGFGEVIALTGDPAGEARLGELVGGRHVLIGSSDVGVADRGMTPTGRVEPLVTVHANRVNAVLAGKRLAFASAWAGASVGIVWLGLVAFLAFSARASLGASAGAIVAGPGVAALVLWATGHYLLPSLVVLPPAVGALAAAGHLGWRHLRFREMLQRAFGSYVSEDVLAWLQETGGRALAPDAAERRAIAVLFSDIAGYTRMSNALPPSEVMASLRLYLTEMIAVVRRHGGYIDKINGDGLMVLFGAPRAVEDAPDRAVKCALEMHERAADLSGAWHALTGGELGIRVGVATGEAFVGNLGAEGHVEYTAIGRVVNLAARLESQAPVGGALLCEETVDVLPAPPAGEWTALALKGYEDEGPVRVWRVESTSLGLGRLRSSQPPQSR